MQVPVQLYLNNLLKPDFLTFLARGLRLFLFFGGVMGMETVVVDDSFNNLDFDSNFE